MNPIEIITKRITEERLRAFLGKPFAEMIKFVADVDRGVIALGGEMHSNAEIILLENGSLQKNLWGGNVYPNAKEGERIEYASLINVRPSQGNPALEVQNVAIKEKMEKITKNLLPI